MKRPLRTLLLVSLVLVTVPVLADAPPTQYAQFLSDTPTIQDTKTFLEWDRFALREKKNFSAAATSCVGFGRLPTVKELLTLVDEQPHLEYEFGKTVAKAVDDYAFGDYTGEDVPYWSSTPTGDGQRWGVSFKDGTMAKLPEGGQGYARCVK
jgi:hypothetical protein